MSRLVRNLTPALNGSAVTIADGDVRLRSMKIPAGSFAVPFWLRPDGDNTRVVRVNALPWQGVIRAGTLQVLASAPGASAQPALVFASDWSTATGDDVTAVRDGGKWDDMGGETSLRRVRAVTGFPTTNAFSVDFNGEQGASVDHSVTTHVPAIGGSVWWRIYARYNYTGSGHPNQHWFHRPAGPATGYIPWTYRWHATGTGNDYVNFDFIYDIGAHTYTNAEWKLHNTLLKGVIYRIELELRRVSSTHFRAYPRVYLGDSTTGPWDENNFVNHLGETMAFRAFEADMLDLVDFSHLMLTQNGPGGATAVATNAIDYGAIAKSVEGWIGPYVPGESAA